MTLARPSSSHHDVIIIGAGAAGLAAARALHERKLDVIVLEARDRAGGRMYTLHDQRGPDPVELGAEFVHGRAAELVALVRQADLRLIDISGRRWQADGRRFRLADDYFERLDRVMRRLDEQRTPDRSFADFLATRPGGRALARDRALARRFVEGFQAADTARISERALAEGGSPGDDLAERRIGRVIDGYDAVVRWLAGPLGARVRLSSPVTRVAWSRGAVDVETSDADGATRDIFRARAAIITVPLGVLKSQTGERGAIAFEPAIVDHREALEGLAMGHVLRVVLQLSDRFWAHDAFVERVSADELHTLSFLWTPDDDFPTWWTAYPSTTPRLVAWQGGPRALAIAVRGRAEVEARALAAFARQFRLSRARVDRLVDDVWFHDWTHDPFSRGAYSYQAVGGLEAPTRLAAPVARTLFFAGEAADADGATGTVHGALATGERAASRVARALGA